MPSVLSRCWLGARKCIRPVKTEWWGAGVVICLQRGADLHMAQLMPLPLTVSCYSKIQIGFTFLVPADLDSPGKRAVKRVCVCVCVPEVFTRTDMQTDCQADMFVTIIRFPTGDREKKLEKKHFFCRGKRTLSGAATEVPRFAFLLAYLL